MGTPVLKTSRRAARRYRYARKEHKIIRFASPRNKRISTTQIFDISESGVSFTTAIKIAPRIGEIIKMDFSPMPGYQIACTGRVARIEEPTQNAHWAKFPDTVKVGVSFLNMPLAYRRTLAQSLRSAFQNLESQKHSRNPFFNFNIRQTWLYQNFASVIISFVLLGGLAWGTYYILTMIDIKRPRQKADWAEGFFNKVIEKQNR
ncbi:MAG: PilZ domain-containing protein [Oligoflexia bacterium]|nr:PilZ domain-containing protein [Oligoflexia bacterium]